MLLLVPFCGADKEGGHTPYGSSLTMPDETETSSGAAQGAGRHYCQVGASVQVRVKCVRKPSGPHALQFMQEFEQHHLKVEADSGGCR